MGSLVVDLRDSTVNGKKVMPRVAELVYCLLNYPNLETPDLIRKMYGPCEPEDARNALKQTAYQARKVGIMIVSATGRRARYTIQETEELA